MFGYCRKCKQQTIKFWKVVDGILCYVSACGQCGEYETREWKEI